jgi:hypothetical protein
VREVLLEDVHVVAVWVQRRKPVLGTLSAVVAVVVVGGDVRDLLLAEDPDQTSRQGRLAGRGIADDAEKNRSRHQTLTVSPASIRSNS